MEDHFMGKPLGMSDIARAVGCSKNTVSLALRGSPAISAKTAKRVLDTAKALGYEKNAAFSRFMSEIKTSGLKKYRETIALINANEDRCALSAHPTIPRYVEGIRRAAEREGFAVDEFWLHDPGLDGRKLARILRSRGIRGGVITGLMDNNRLPSRFTAVWRDFKFVITGVRTYGPTLNFACADHFLIAYHATLQALAHGYLRPALVLDREIDSLIEGRFTGGFLRAQLAMPQEARIDPFFEVSAAKRNAALFKKWFESNAPDAIICLFNTPKKWLEELGVRVPEDVALIQLERRRDEPEWAGMDQRNDLAGEAAVEKLSQMLYSNAAERSGTITATLVSPEWAESDTIMHKPRRAPRLAKMPR